MTEELKTVPLNPGAVKVIKKDNDLEMPGYQLIRFIKWLA
jgi:hypothetical protein